MRDLSDLKPIEPFIAVTDVMCPVSGRTLWGVGNAVEFRPSVEDVRVWWVVVDGRWRQWVSSDPNAVVDMHRLVLASKPQSKQSLRFVAAHDGSVLTDPPYTESRVSWRAGDGIAFRAALPEDKVARDESWLMFVNHERWCVAPECVDAVYQHLEKQALKRACDVGKLSQFVADPLHVSYGSVAGRAACSKPNVQEIDRVDEPRPRDFIATGAGGIVNSVICWDKGNEVVLFKDRQSWVVQIRSWTAGESALRASNPFVVAAHRFQPDEVEQIWAALNRAPTLRASGTPPANELARYAARDADSLAVISRQLSRQLKPMDFVATESGSVDTSPHTAGCAALVSWVAGDTIVFARYNTDVFGWALHRSCVRGGWEATPITPGEEARVLNYLCSLGSLKPVLQNLAALSFIAPTAGSVSTSTEGGLGWNEGERIVFRAFDRLSAHYEDGAWELILGGNTCKISRDRVLDVHRGLVKLRDSAKEPQKEPEPEKEPEPTPDPYRMHRLNDVNNSLTHAQTAVTKTLSALQALRMAVTGEPRHSGKRKSIIKRPTSLATAAKSMRHMLRELQQLTEQMEKRSGK